jgi:flagellar basal body-associated protein FliL
LNYALSSERWRKAQICFITVTLCAFILLALKLNFLFWIILGVAMTWISLVGICYSFITGLTNERQAQEELDRRVPLVIQESIEEEKRELERLQKP